MTNHQSPLMTGCQQLLNWYGLTLDLELRPVETTTRFVVVVRRRNQDEVLASGNPTEIMAWLNGFDRGVKEAASR